MKKIKKTNGGFTLVELVVILVILAIMAAVLTPALTGYIDRANKQTVLANGRSIYIAAQSVISEAYIKDDFEGDTIDAATGTFGGDTVDAADIFTLAEIALGDDEEISITFNDKGQISAFAYTSKGFTAQSTAPGGPLEAVVSE